MLRGLNNAQKALDEAEPADEEYTELRDALAKAQAAYDNISGQLNGYQQQLDAGKQQMYAQGLISSPSLSNTELVTEAKAALRKMKLQLLQGQLQLSTGTAAATSAFAAAQQQLADARTQLDDGWAEYDSGKEQLELPAPNTRPRRPKPSKSSPTARSRSTMPRSRSATSRAAHGMCSTGAAP